MNKLFYLFVPDTSQTFTGLLGLKPFNSTVSRGGTGLGSWLPQNTALQYDSIIALLCCKTDECEGAAGLYQVSIRVYRHLSALRVRVRVRVKPNPTPSALCPLGIWSRVPLTEAFADKGVKKKRGKRHRM